MAAGVQALGTLAVSPPEQPEHSRAMSRYVMREGETQTEQPTEADTTRWRVPSDLRMLGQVQGSALLKPHYLLRRGDGQVVQVSELLNTVVSELDPERSPDEV